MGLHPRYQASLRAAVAAAALVWVLPAASAAEGEAPAADLDARLARGEVIVTPRRVEGFAVAALTVDTVIDAPPEQVWAIVTDCRAYRAIMPHVEDSLETERTGGRSVCKWAVHMPFPFRNVNVWLEFTGSADGQRWQTGFRQVRGDFVRNEGYWHLSRFGDTGKRTRIAYRQHSVLDLPVPASMVQRGHTAAMREMVARLRAAVRSQ